MRYLVLLIAAATSLISCNQEPVEKTTPTGRDAFELRRLQDPETGKIPEGMRQKELAFASTLPKASLSKRSTSLQEYKAIGPYNVGGRTRDVVYDINNPTTILAGAVSGGVWRTTNSGQSWTRTTNYEQHAAVSCIEQDVRTGKGNVWFYGTGEYRGNSASKSFSATYLGTGVYRSQDSGKTWIQLPSTVTEPQSISTWSYVHRLALDPSRTDSTVILAATHRGIYYSNDAGDNWIQSLGRNSSSSLWSDIVVSDAGVFYASIQSTGGTDRGFWRSEDGLNWTSITSSSFPSTHDRSILALAPSNQNILYVLSETPGNGTADEPSSTSPEYNSIWRYTYVSGDGSGTGGSWVDRSSGLPSGAFRATYSSFNGYCTGMAVKPDNANVVFIGGSNMFRSTDGFQTQAATEQIGGYSAQGYSNFNWLTDNHHPDLHQITFHPNNPNYMLCSTDGGLHFTQDCEAFKVIWENYNNGYVSSQFYAVSVDKWSENEVVTGGLQDNGTWFTNQLSNTNNWVNLRGSDGAYTAITDNGRTHYVSTQYANIQRRITDNNGNVLNNYDVMPDGTSGYLFVHPFTLDPADDNTMYLPNENNLYTNTNLAATENGVKSWTLTATVSSSADITAVSASTNERGTVYLGMANTRIYKVEDAHLGATTATDITSNISSGAYTSCIAVDERNADEVIAIYSNYNVISAWYSQDGGNTWEDIEGNLKGTAAPGTPEGFGHISDGPSFRWMEIIPVTDSTQVYLLGTSIGLFATNKLDGDNTVWVQQADDVIGNVVVDMIDYRSSDGFVAVGTHGNGVFTTYIKNDFDITSVEPISAEEALNLNIYPNPASAQINVSFELEQAQLVKISVLNLSGQQMIEPFKRDLQRGQNTISRNLDAVSPGMYFVTIKGENFQLTKAISVQ